MEWVGMGSQHTIFFVVYWQYGCGPRGVNQSLFYGGTGRLRAFLDAGELRDTGMGDGAGVSHLGIADMGKYHWEAFHLCSISA
jgi:hypothetical protein